MKDLRTMRYSQMYLNDSQHRDHLRNCIDILDAHDKSIVRELTCVDEVELEKNDGEPCKEAGRESILSNLMIMDFLSFPLGTTTHVDGDESLGWTRVLMPLEVERASRVLRWRRTVL